MHATRNSSRRVWLYVALVLAAVVAAIAIPNLKLARMTVNETSASGLIHLINAAQTKYLASNPVRGYACSLETLGEAHLIPISLASGTNTGYVIEISDCGSNTPKEAYRVFAQPVTKDKTGHWVFCSDQTARVKASPESREDCFDQGVMQP